MNTIATRRITRRTLLGSLPSLLMMPRGLAQSARSPIRVRGINHVTLHVSDLKRSVDFYQGLFGMPVLHRQGVTNVSLQIGSGPQHLGLSAAGPRGPRIDHICLAVDDFNVDRITGVFLKRGFTRTDATGDLGPMQLRVRVRGSEVGGAKEGTPELYFGDPDGIMIQLQDRRYCGGAGALGNVCGAAEPSPKKGLLALRGWSHCTNFVSDAARSNTFYQDLLGLRVQAHQGPAEPLLSLGNGVEFVMFVAGRGGPGAGAPPRRGINHLCMTMDRFNPDAVIKVLESYGIKARGSAESPAGPLVHYISLRMENRGGGKQGTPELYFTDPDGLVIQLQDVKYCGGAGVLGDVCP